MTFKYTASQLEKIEDIIKQINYQIRYEKGSFKSGYCILNDKRVIVVSKFFSTESKINALIEILDKLSFDSSLLSEESRSYYQELQKVS